MLNCRASRLCNGVPFRHNRGVECGKEASEQVLQGACFAGHRKKKIAVHRTAPCHLACCVSQKSRQSPRTSPQCCRAGRSAACVQVAGNHCKPRAPPGQGAPRSTAPPPQSLQVDQTAHGLLWQAHGQQTAARYISKFEFPYTLRGQQCQFVMMAVVGHLQNTEFGDRYRHDLLHAAAMSALVRLPAHCSISRPFKLNTKVVPASQLTSLLVATARGLHATLWTCSTWMSRPFTRWFPTTKKIWRTCSLLRAGRPRKIIFSPCPVQCLAWQQIGCQHPVLPVLV